MSNEAAERLRGWLDDQEWETLDPATVTRLTETLANALAAERRATVEWIRAVLREADEMIPKKMGLFWKASPTRRDQWRLDLVLFRALLDAAEERG